jgi:hypothetical protein
MWKNGGGESRRMSAYGTLRISRDVRLEFGMRTKADIRRPL